jgi:hypothetical protein
LVVNYQMNMLNFQKKDLNLMKCRLLFFNRFEKPKVRWQKIKNITDNEIIKINFAKHPFNLIASYVIVYIKEIV